MKDMDVLTGFSFSGWMEIGGALFALISGFALGWWRNMCSIRKKKQKTDKEIDWHIHSQIHETLTELRYSTDAARAQLVQFHNGEYFMDGVSMRKMSLTHESLSKGVSGEGDRLKGLLVSLFTPLMGKVIENSPILYHTKDDKDCFFKNFFESGSILTYMVLPVNYQNKISGYVIIEWCSVSKSKYAEKHYSEISEKLLDARNQIQIQLDEQLRAFA